MLQSNLIKVQRGQPIYLDHTAINSVAGARIEVPDPASPVGLWRLPAGLSFRFKKVFKARAEGERKKEKEKERGRWEGRKEREGKERSPEAGTRD